METKICSKCKEEKELIEFRSRSDRPNNPYRSCCKKCDSIGSSKYRKNNKLKESTLKYRENNKELISENQKKWKEKNKEYFIEYNQTDKEKNRKKEWREENKDYHKSYNEKNKDRLSEIHSEWYQNNKAVVKERSKKYLYNRLETDELFKLTFIIRRTIRQSIKNMGYKKNSRTYIILGCSFEEFKCYLEYQFKEGMNWLNHGKWHLDHKIPVSWAKSEEEVLELNHYTNFQPLWAKDNLIKGNRYKSE